VASATPDYTTYNHTTYATAGSTDLVFKTIADINAKSFSPGDNVLFKKDGLWREQLTVTSSGTSGNQITYGSYGVGTSKPKIYGSTGFSTVDGTTWSNSSIIAETGNLWNEGFEGPGFQGGPYSQLVGAGSTIVPNSTAIARPADGGSYIGYFDKVSPNYNAQESKDFGSTMPVIYARAYINVADITSLTTNGEHPFFSVFNTEYGDLAVRFFISKVGNTSFQFAMRTFNNGTDKYITDPNISTLNTWYKIEGKYDTAAKQYEFKVNGTVVDSGSLTGTILGGGQWIKFGSIDADDWTFYLDRMAIDSTKYLADTLTLPANVWKTTYNPSPKTVWFVDNDGTTHWGKKESSLVNVNALYDYYSGDGNLYVYNTGVSGPNVDWSSIEAATRNQGISGQTKNYITIQDLEVGFCNDFGISTLTYDTAGSGTNWIIQRNTVHHLGDNIERIKFKCVK
jgi:hypothetical protein